MDESTSAVISDDDTLALRNKAAMELGEVMVVAANKYCWDNEPNGSCCTMGGTAFALKLVGTVDRTLP